MLIGVMSDSHDHVEGLQAALRVFKERGVGMIVHCGDWVAPFMFKALSEIECKLVTVWGNNEGDLQLCMDVAKGTGKDIEFAGKVAELEVDGKKIVVYHGDHSALLVGLIDCNKYDVIFTGHTHSPSVQMLDGTLVVNPGTTAGIHGIETGLQKTCAVYDSQNHQAEIINI